jgi:hypothetical protein
MLAYIPYMDPMGMCSEDVFQWENEWKIPLGHVGPLATSTASPSSGKKKVSGIPIANLRYTANKYSFS